MKGRKGERWNILPSFHPLVPLFYSSSKLGERRGGKVFLIILPTSPPSRLIIFLHKVSGDHLLFISFPSLLPLYFNPNSALRNFSPQKKKEGGTKHPPPLSGIFSRLPLHFPFSLSLDALSLAIADHRLTLLLQPA